MPAKTYFWRSKSQSEIDYIEEINGTLTPYQLKWNPKSKAKLAPLFVENYISRPLQIINRNNFSDFLLDSREPILDTSTEHQ